MFKKNLNALFYSYFVKLNNNNLIKLYKLFKIPTHFKILNLKSCILKSQIKIIIAIVSSQPEPWRGCYCQFIAVGSPRQALRLVVPFQKFMGRFLIVSALLTVTGFRQPELDCVCNVCVS
jgi:hypothetical protein